MREIKFRAWDNDNHTMYYSSEEMDNAEGLIIWQCDHRGLFFIIDEICGGEHNQRSAYKMPNQVLMQYTGLKDKNGVEIYEGDIVNNGVNSWLVKWMDTFSGFYLINTSNMIEVRLTKHKAEQYLFIVGNEFENNKLL